MLGPYEIQSPLGAGGMGEVYRARDTRLERTVAIKILSAHLSTSPEAKQRFDREARAISSLSSHIVGEEIHRQKFLVNSKVDTSNTAPLSVVLNWPSETQK